MKMKEQLRFNTIEQAISELRLDRRRKWFEWSGKIVRNEKVTLECSGCDGGGCSECGYSGKRVRCFPVYAIANGIPVLIASTTLTKEK